VTDDDLGPEPGQADAAGPDAIGTVAEEAAKLFGALSGWAKDHGEDLGHEVSSMASGAAHTLRDVNEHIATDSAECSFCPVCRTIHAVRGLSPEVKTHLAVASANLMQAAAALMATSVPDQARTKKPAGEDIEKINLDEDWPEE
jgi:hypothetical protein